MAGKFEVYEEKVGRYRFRLKSGNGQIVGRGTADRVHSTNRQRHSKVEEKVSNDAPPGDAFSS